MTTLLAIDPGATGAIAVFRPWGVHDMRDPWGGSLALELASLCRDHENPTVVIEQVGGMPGQGGASQFAFGKRYGELLGVCAAFEIEPILVSPARWKGALGLRRGTQTTAQFKCQSLNLANQVFPGTAWFKRAKDDGRAEAALIGHYYLKHDLVS